MIKTCMFFFLALEIAQVLVTMLLCAVFLMLKYMLHMTDQKWQKWIAQLHIGKLCFWMLIVEGISLCAIIPFSYWWFPFVGVAHANAWSMAVPILSVLLTIIKIGAVRRYCKKNIHKEKKTMDEHAIYE